MIFVLTLFLVVGGIVAVTSNPDTFSPAKFFLLFFFLFHLGAVIEPPSIATLALISVPLFLILLLCFVEAIQTQYTPAPVELVRLPWGGKPDYAIPVFIWIITIPSVFAQFYMIVQFGGIDGYVTSIGTRVVDWSGFGWARVLIALSSPLNVAFLAIGLARKRSTLWWTLFCVHLAFVLAVGFLSGSRSGLLNVLALLACVYHYLRRPIHVAFAAGLVLLLVGLSSLLGVARNNFKLQDGEVTTGLQSTTESFSFNSFYYGIEPLELITAMPQLVLANGMTFISLFTNAIPRSFYPEKPETGGIFFTKNYAGDAWEGYSNLTPTFLGEWIINFGYLVGILGFFLTYGGMIYFVLHRYISLLRNPLRERNEIFALDVAIYIHILWTFVGLMIGELTSVVLGLVLNILVPLFLLRLWLVWREKARAPLPKADPRLT